MRKSRVFGGFILTFALAFSAAAAVSQQQPQQQPKQPPAQQPTQQPPKKPVVDTATARLTGAKNVMVTRARGNQIPYDVISSTLEGWGRFTMVDTADKADLVVTVATSGADNGVRVSGSNAVSPLSGRPERSSNSSVDLSNAEITMTVYDAKNKRVLWTAVETAKSAMKQTARENNLVEAAEKLASKFHDRLEPPPPPKDED
jgi:hypothetical protein